MKIKTLIVCILAVLLALPAGEAYAQKKKTGAAKRPAAAARKGAAPAPAAKPLTRDALVGHRFYGIMIDSDLGKDVGFYSWLALKDNGSIDLTLLDSEFNGRWTMSGSTLVVTSGQLEWRLTSSDGGKKLAGTLTNKAKGMTSKFLFYRVANGATNEEVTLKSFKKNTFQALVEVTTSSGTVVFPVKFQPTMNEDGEGGTYKITSDNKLALGLVKGSFTITEVGVRLTSSLGGDYTDEYWDRRQEYYFKLGNKRIDGMGSCPVYLRLFNQ